MTATKFDGIAMRRFRRLRQFGKLLRFIEAAAALILLSYTSIQIPAAARNSGDFIRRTAAFLISPSFVFLLCNAIVLVLLKTGHFSSESGSTGTGIGNICGEMYSTPLILGNAAAEQKRACVQNRACRRRWSENFERKREQAKLRRAETECHRKGVKAWPAVARERGEVVGAHDRVDAKEQLDAEEFRRTIEDFIAKRQRFLRLESQSLAVVASSDEVGHRVHEC